QPYLARVELPAWVAEDAQAVDLLHAALVSQSRVLGARPYPYALHRAHEVAVVSLAEKDQLEQMLLAEMARRGMPPGEKSNKQIHKDGKGRKRHTL
ncbi:MAG TPA: DNA double-strand break repair nuclease NurA, partial [Anaerolineaceae bacterium]